MKQARHAVRVDIWLCEHRNIHDVYIQYRFLYHVAIPTDVSLLSLSGRQSRAAGLQRMTNRFILTERRSTSCHSATFCICMLINTKNWGIRVV